MKPLIFAGLFLTGAISIWLLLWDFIDYLTTGLNEGIWDIAIIINGLPSICVGIFILAIVTVLGINVLFK